MVERVIYALLIAFLPLSAMAQSGDSNNINNITIPIVLAIAALVAVAGFSWKLSAELHKLREAISELKLNISEERASKKELDELKGDYKDLHKDVDDLKTQMAVFKALSDGNTPSMSGIPVVRD